MDGAFNGKGRMRDGRGEARSPTRDAEPLHPFVLLRQVLLHLLPHIEDRAVPADKAKYVSDMKAQGGFTALFRLIFNMG